MRNVISPLDGTVLASVPSNTVEDLNQLLESAFQSRDVLQSQPRWQRIEWLRALHTGLMEDQDALAVLMAHEIGKPIMLARAELARAISLIEQTIAELRTTSGDAPYVDDQAVHSSRTAITKRFPIGVIAAITPFNFPVNLVLHKVLPAIATGCPVIVKPSERCHAVSMHLAALIKQTGMPPAGVQFDFAYDGPTHANILAADSRVAFLSFTGSDTVGRILAKQASGKPQIHELGGSGAVYIGDDADVASAAKKCAIAGMAFAGQVCISVQRVYVHKSIYVDFQDALLKEIASIVPMNPLLDGHVLGPMIDPTAATRFVNQCTSLSSQQLLVAPQLRDNRFVSPAIVTNIPHSHPLIQEEAFAPVIVLQAVDDIKSAISFMNGTRFGLQSGVFTHRITDALLAHNELRGGAVYINDVPTVRIDKLSYGGDGASGSGREGIRDVMLAYTTPRHLVFS